MNPIYAGLVAAVPLAVFFTIYLRLRGSMLAAFLQEQDERIAGLPEITLRFLVDFGFVGAAFLFGALAGLVYSWLGMPAFRYAALGAAALFSLLALVSKTPLPLDKIIWNIAVAVVMGFLVPFLAA